MDESVRSLVMDKLQWLDGLETESKELKFLRSCVSVVDPIPRQLSARCESTDAEGQRPLKPSTSRPRIAYDFDIGVLLARLMKHDARARRPIPYGPCSGWCPVRA